MASYATSMIQQIMQTRVVEITKQKFEGRVEYALQYSPDDPLTYLGDPGAESRREVLVVVRSPNFWTRLLSGADLGFSESYMLQEIDCEVEQLYKLSKILLKHRGGIRRSWFYQLASGLAQTFTRTNDVEQAQINASAHYDTSNNLFANFLSPDMNYSCAQWSANLNESLEKAQNRKVQNLLRKAKISASHHILDIGCGWGDLAIQAAQTTNCRVTGITLSKEQKSWADDRIKAAGLQDRVDILYCDYRNVPAPPSGTYDRIISVGMFEHVGREYLAEYFATISRLLHPKHGILVLDGITAITKFHNIQTRTDLFILKYIFPGGYLPTVSILLNHIYEGSAGSLEVTSAESSGSHYGKTCAVWRENFLSNWDTIKAHYQKENPQSTDFEIEAFRRKWLYYFICAEISFVSRVVNNFTITAARTPGSDLSYETLPYVLS
ncbi:cyclopropane-fatty-acyl-phospholipid synthase [Aspergillus bertholletiae]|uniref:Cyclopropane-fatty-acyl-phospholipid synthase n=1 Tax=Aspergillus bertholletiae TaxID=1226010 RepID=A0A5N7BF84_9EURO|nr:cyclopropane-fatty-acyl-phospholipid synthase [Aspergillus bertholletiae]